MFDAMFTTILQSCERAGALQAIHVAFSLVPQAHILVEVNKK